MTQHEIIPLLIGFGLVILFGLLFYYIRHLQNSHAKEKAKLLVQIGNLEDKFAGATENCEYYKKTNESLSDTKRLLDLELQDREQHEALIDQQNAMILELKGMVKNLIHDKKQVDAIIEKHKHLL